MTKRAFQRIVLVLVLVTAGVALAGWARAAEKKGSDEHKLVVDAGKTFEQFLNDRDLEWFRKNKDKAKGFLIAPQIVKAGFVFGGSGGRAVLVYRAEVALGQQLRAGIAGARSDTQNAISFLQSAERDLSSADMSLYAAAARRRGAARSVRGRALRRRD